MDPMRAATAIVASPAWDLGEVSAAAAASIVAVEALVVAVEASVAVVEALVAAAEASGVVAVDAPEVAAVVAGKHCES
jgi:hypothetical protein